MPVQIQLNCLKELKNSDVGAMMVFLRGEGQALLLSKDTVTPGVQWRPWPSSSEGWLVGWLVGTSL